MMRFFVAMSTVCLNGCAAMSMQSRLEKEAQLVADIVNAYCTVTTSAELRQAFSKEMNTRAAPDRIAIACAQAAPEPVP